MSNLILQRNTVRHKRCFLSLIEQSVSVILNGIMQIDKIDIETHDFQRDLNAEIRIN